jgi:hypothetical protein
MMVGAEVGDGGRSANPHLGACDEHSASFEVGPLTVSYWPPSFRRMFRAVVVRRCCNLSDLHRQHRNRSPINARDWKTDTFALLLGGKNVEQRQIVIRRRNREDRVPSERFVIDERLVLAGQHHILGGTFEAHRPVVGLARMPAPRIGVEDCARDCRCRGSARPRPEAAPASCRSQNGRMRAWSSRC